MVSAKARIREAYAQCAQAIVMGTVSLERAEDAGFSVHSPVFPVSQAASLAHVHPQTLREYDRAGLVQPMRTPGGARRYSISDIDRLNQTESCVANCAGSSARKEGRCLLPTLRGTCANSASTSLPAVAAQAGGGHSTVRCTKLNHATPCASSPSKRITRRSARSKRHATTHNADPQH